MDQETDASASSLSSEPGMENPTTPDKKNDSSVTSIMHQQIKSEDYRKLFHLPPEEVLVQDFNCAFQKKILLQGHMYLFEQYVCFYSNIFGYEKKKVLPLKDVIFVRKAWTAGLFPNAIEIGAWGKKYFFASFLSRDEAYRLIINGWSQRSGHARVFLESQSSLVVLPSDIPLQVPESFTITRSAAKNGLNNGMEESEEKRVVTKLDERKPDPSSRFGSLWNVNDGSAPALSPEFKRVMESEFPVDVDDFFELFFSDAGINFTDMFHKRCGDEDFTCSRWSPHPNFGYVRDISFRHPVNLYFGPRSALCQESQRFCVYRNSHLIIEISQQMADIPYADYFLVEVRWDIVRVQKDPSTFHSSVTVSVNVRFSKKTLWRSKIEQATLDECKETYSIWVREAFHVLGSKFGGNSDYENIPEISGLEDEEVVAMVDEVSLVERMTSDLGENAHTQDKEKKKRFPDSLSFEVCRALRKASVGLGKMWKSLLQNPVLMMMVVIAVLAVVTQVTSLMVMARALNNNSNSNSGVNLNSNSNIGRMGMGNCGSRGVVDAVTWLEQRAHHLKEEIALTESRLEVLNQDFSLLKLHMNLLEQMNLFKPVE